MICKSRELRRADGFLGKIYNGLYQKLFPQEKKSFRNGQRAWIEDRDAKCSPLIEATLDFEKSWDGQKCVYTAIEDRFYELLWGFPKLLVEDN